MTDRAEAITVPLRSLEIVDADGARRRHLRVFCPVESRSLDPRICARCDLCVEFPEDPSARDAELRCRIPRRTDAPRAASWFVGSDAVSAWLPAGVVTSPVVVCARFDAPARAVGEALERHSLGAAVVIDERTLPLGVVTHVELATRGATPVLAVVDSRVPQVDEGAPLAEVISRMTYRRAHRVVLTRSDGRVAGLVSELDVLHWIAVGGASW